MFFACIESQESSEKIEMESTMTIDGEPYQVDSISCRRFSSLSYEKEIFEAYIYITKAFSEFDTLGDVEEVRFSLKFDVLEGEHLFLSSEQELPYLWFEVKRFSKATFSNSPRYDATGKSNKLTISNLDKMEKRLDLSLYFHYRPVVYLPEKYKIDLKFKNVPIDWQE